MKHYKSYAKLGKDTSHRLAMLNNILFSLVQNGKLISTVTKVKGARPYIERMITAAKNINGIPSRHRVLLSKVKNPKVLEQLIKVATEKFSNRNGGYLRIIKLGYRQGDRAETALLELVE